MLSVKPRKKISEHKFQYITHNLLNIYKIIHFETDVMSGLQFFSQTDNRRFTFIAHHKKMGYLKGQPDMVLILPNEVVFVELKTTTGRQTPEQKEIQRKFNALGLRYLIWRNEEDVLNFCKWGQYEKLS